MRKILLLLFIPLFIACDKGNGSTENGDITSEETVSITDSIKSKAKIELFTSKRGSIVKFVDYKLSSVKSKYSTPEVRVRKYMANNETGYFYQIVKKGSYSSKTASVEYADLLEALKALELLKTEESADLKLGGDYLENSFITEDGFEIGYYVSEGKSTWYIILDKYGSDNSLYFDSVASIENSLLEGKSRIEELKK